MQSRVAVIRCASYQSAVVTAAVSRAVELLGGIRRFVKPAERVLVKPNILSGEPPERAATTHPSVVGAVTALLRRAGAEVAVGDSPGIGSPKGAIRRSGIQDAIERTGATVAPFDAAEHADFIRGERQRRFMLVSDARRADAIVSVAKLKTHALERLTGAVKNQLGCVYGLHKARLHMEIPDPLEFAQALVDLTELLAPRLYVMDAIDGMEGNGPRSGDPRAIGAIIASTDPVAVDATASQLIGLDPSFVPTTIAGADAGLGTYREDEITYVGDGVGALIQDDFRVVRAPVRSGRLVTHSTIVKQLFTTRPKIDPELCVRCGLCVAACPVPGKAVDFPGGDRKRTPRYDYRACIRCFCCQEICPHGAIGVAVPLLAWLGRKCG
jgi:uncharacterized protein (DUF362 family)/Pyruvate/2-oxoacid:ferredoxin oxidoreductase delta subunit